MVKEKGFKKTEIGWIPEDWEVVKLGDNCTLKARIGWQGLTTTEYLQSGEYYLVTGTDFANGYIDWENCVFVEKERFDQDRNIQIKIKDVLVTKDGTIGKVAYINKLKGKTTLNSGVFVLRPKIEKIDNQFVYYILMSFYFDDFLIKITAGSTITHLYQKDFIHFKFITPPLREQRAITEVLSDADAWIESLEQLIAKKRLIRQGAMQELLSPKEGWEVKKLGDVISSTQLGGNYSNSEEPSGNPLMKMGNIQRGYISLKKVEYIPSNIIPFDKDLLKNEDLLFNTRNTLDLVGKVSIWRSELPIAYFNSNIMRIKFKSDIVVSTVMMNAIFNSNKIIDSLKNIATGTTSVAAIYTRDLLEMEIFFPKSPAEQTRIATILSDIDTEIESLENQLGKARQLKQGMMQELLTGRIRLV